MRLRISFIVAGFIAITLSTAAHAIDIVPWHTDIESAFDMAKKQNVPVLLHFWTPDCIPCKRLDHSVFNRNSVSETLDDFFIPVKINAASNPAIAAKYKVQRFPTDVILSPNDEELHRMITPQNAQQYISQLSAVAFRSGLVPRKKEDVALGSSNETHSVPNRFSHFANQQRQASESQPGINREPTSNSFAGNPQNGQKETVNPYITGQSKNSSNNYMPVSKRDKSTGENTAAQQNPYVQNQPANTNPNVNPNPQTFQPSQQEFQPGDTTNDFVPEQGFEYPSESFESREPVYPDRQQTAPRHQTAPHQQTAPRRSQDRTAYNSNPPAVNVHQQSVPAKQESPKQNPSVALDGYCPVSLIRSDTWRKGDPRWGVIHRGRIYLFASKREKDEFFSRPDEYSPVLSGIDPVALTDGGHVVEGKRAHGVVFRKRVYLFASEANLQKFWKAPDSYSGQVMQAMNKNRPGLR